MIKKIMATAGIIGLLFTGCGASFDISAAALEDYAAKNSGQYVDVSSDYTDYDYIDGVYVLDVDNAHIEMWDLDSSDSAALWFTNNVDTVKTVAVSHTGSNTSKRGSYSIKTSDEYYRILFSDDKGIYAYGDEKVLDTALKAMGIDK